MYITETKRLRLRRLTRGDREAVLSVLTDKRIMVPMRLPSSEEFADEWLDRTLLLYETHGPANWFAERREDGRFVGIMGAVVNETDGASVAELGYLVHPDLQRQGYALEGARACMEYAFDELHADFVTARIVSDNTPSLCLAEKLGMVPVQELLYAQDGETVSYILYAAENPNRR